MKKTAFSIGFWSCVIMLLALTFPNNRVGAENDRRIHVTPIKTEVGVRSLHDLTDRIFSLAEQVRTATAETRQPLINELRRAAESRKQLLLGWMQQDPAQVLDFALPDHILALLSEDLQELFEQRVELDGELEVLFEENETGSRLHHFLKIDNKQIELHFRANSAPDLLTGTQVHVRGVRVGDDIALDGGADATTLASTEMTMTQTSASIASNTFGEQKVLVLLVNFQDKATQPWSVSQVSNLVFGTVNDFYKESSFQQTWLTGSVFGWYTLPLSSATCDQNAIATYAKQAATAAGVNLSAYNKHVYAFPSLSCGWTGWGTYGGSPSQAWINGSMSLRTVGHELGHNFGLYHSRALDCGANVIGSNCSIIEYGDSFDILGQTGVTAHSNAAQKERVGWLNYGISPAITTVQTTGTYWIDPYETVGSYSKALKILKSTDPTTGRKTWYYVEFRRPVGFDSFISGNSTAMNGLVVHTGTEAYSVDEYLLDMTPETSSFSDGSLVVGRSFNDANTNMTITPLLVGATGASVMISFGPQPCVRANPSISLSPSASQWVSPGTTVTYQVSLTNNDSSGCTSSSFDLQAAVPGGWGALFDNSTMTLSAGLRATTALRVMSPSSAANGYYNIGVAASNSSVATYSVSSSVVCSIVSGLTVSVASDQPSYTSAQVATLTANVSAGGVPVSGTKVSFTVTKPNGAKVSGSATTTADGSAVYKYRFNKQKDPIGTYGVAAGATMNGQVGSGVSSFILK